MAKRELTLKVALLEKAEVLGWSVEVNEDGSIDFYKRSPLGEDFGFSIPNSDDIPNEVFLYYDSFDPEDHAVMWYNLRRSSFTHENMRRSIPESLKDLLDDADSIEANLKELSDVLDCCQREYEETIIENAISE